MKKNPYIIPSLIIAAAILAGFWMLKPPPQPPNISIHQAAERGSIEAVKQHLAAGTGVNAKDQNGNTPLHKVARSGFMETIELLIANSADVNAKNSRGTTPRDIAYSSNYFKTADLLRKHGGKHGTIHSAAGGGDAEAVKEFLAAGTDVNAKGGFADGTPLYDAAVDGHKEVVELLIAKGADVNVKAAGGTTPLHQAAFYGQKETAELLIAEGADVNAENDRGRTPLDRAANPFRYAASAKATAELLRKHGGKTGEELK